MRVYIIPKHNIKTKFSKNNQSNKYNYVLDTIKYLQ